GAGSAPVTFDLRLGRDTLTAASFDSAGGTAIAMIAAAGDSEAHEFVGLARHARYVFALAATDAAGNRSRLSNFVGAVTSSGAPPPPRPGPGIIQLRRPSGAPVLLAWRGWGAGAAQRIG